jgi:alginate O-acetyltransferase complex protein AlgI
MQFNSLVFLFFFAVVLALVAQVRPERRRFVLLPASLIFYGWWDWRFLGLILFTITLDWACGRLMARPRANRRIWLLTCVITDLTVLAFFKYFDFFVDNAVDLIEMIGLVAHRPTLSILLPIGISFFTFQSMAYTIDVYRGRVEPVREWSVYAAYVSFFPQLVAGPIERAQRLIPQIVSPAPITVERLRSGFVLVLIGLARKVLIADTAAPHVDRIFANPEAYSSADLAVGAFLFALQIYGDFAGYSDMARGLARMLGIDLIVNFRQPYFATSITDFWRRWHVSLSFWLRDYLYIPLGGNRRGRYRTYGNLLTTMLLGGLWHGAAWTFVLWGGIHGIALAVHKAWMDFRGVSDRSPGWAVRAAGWMMTMFVVGLSWIFFRAETFDQAVAYFGGLLSFRSGVDFITGLIAALCLAAVLVIDFCHREESDDTVVRSWHWLPRGAVYAFVIVLVIAFSGANVPFIYFQF